MMSSRRLLSSNLEQFYKILLVIAFIIYSPCVVFANTYNIEADGFYTMDEELKENKYIAKERARLEAKRAATEKAGVYIESFSSVKNGELIKDEINTISAQILKIQDEEITTEMIDGTVRYKCHIVAVVESSNILDKLRQDRQKLYEVIEQYKRREEELLSIKNELLELKTKYKTANKNDKESISLKIKHNEARFEAMKYVDQGNDFYYQGDYKQAIKLYHCAVELDSSLALAWNNLGFSYCKIDDFHKGLEYLFISAKLEPENPATWNNIGYAYAGMGDYKKAMNYYRKATMELNSDWSPAWNNLGAAYGYMGDYQAEIIYCKKATQLDSNNASAWNNLGAAYNGIKDYGKAIDCLQKAIDMDKSSATTWFNIGYAYCGIKDWDRAAGCFSKARELKPHNQKYKDAHDYAKQMQSDNG